MLKTNGPILLHKEIMKLEEFAKSAGCIVKLLPKPEIGGGRWAYHEKDAPHISYVGFRTEKAAYKAFIEDCCGSTDVGRAVLKLLQKVERLEKLNRELRLNQNT